METKSTQLDKSGHFETCLPEGKASPVLAEIKVSYKSKQKNKIKIAHSKEVFDILYPLFDKDTIEYQEQFYLLLLNYSNRVLGWIKLSAGGTTGTIIDPKMVFSIALKTNSHQLILAHNHPSGNLSPSESDTAITKKILEGGRLLDIKLLDHLIITPEEKYFSFADEGLMY